MVTATSGFSVLLIKRQEIAEGTMAFYFTNSQVRISRGAVNQPVRSRRDASGDPTNCAGILFQARKFKRGLGGQLAQSSDPNLILPSSDDLFSSGTLGRYSEILDDVLEKRIDLPYELSEPSEESAA